MKNLIFMFLIVVLQLVVQSVFAQGDVPFPVCTPEEENVDSEQLSILDSKIQASTYRTVNGVVIVRNGNLIFEKYYNNYSRQTLHPLYSATKSFTSALTGIAIQQGEITGVDALIKDYFPQYSTSFDNDPLKSTLTIKHLLTMTSGFTDESLLWYSADWVKYMLDQPIVNRPGELWTYINGNVILLSGIIQNSTGQSAEDYAQTNLFTPLGISTWDWHPVPNQVTQTAGGLSMRPLDMALFGQLYLNKGMWKGTQVIPEDWIEESTNVQVINSKLDMHYGYLFWQYKDDSRIGSILNPNDIYFASGANDQKIYVIPHLNCVIVMTCSRCDTKEMMMNEILPALMNGTSSDINNNALSKDPNTLHLAQNYPNPFTDITTIKYYLALSGHVDLKVFNSLGQDVEILINENQTAGEHEIIWQPKGIHGGVYFYILQCGALSKVKMLVFK